MIYIWTSKIFLDFFIRFYVMFFWLPLRCWCDWFEIFTCFSALLALEATFFYFAVHAYWESEFSPNFRGVLRGVTQLMYLGEHAEFHCLSRPSVTFFFDDVGVDWNVTLCEDGGDIVLSSAIVGLRICRSNAEAKLSNWLPAWLNAQIDFELKLLWMWEEIKEFNWIELFAAKLVFEAAIISCLLLQNCEVWVFSVCTLAIASRMWVLVATTNLLSYLPVSATFGSVRAKYNREVPVSIKNMVNVKFKW